LLPIIKKEKYSAFTLIGKSIAIIQSYINQRWFLFNFCSPKGCSYTVLQTEINEAGSMKWREIAANNNNKLQGFDRYIMFSLQFCNINSKTG